MNAQAATSEPAAPRLSPLRQAYEDAQRNVRELLEHAARRTPDGGFSIALSRDSKGLTKPEVTVRQCDEFPTLAECEAAATAAYDRLRMKYPMPSGYVGAEGEPS